MAEIRWTHEAGRWLEEIHEYISADDPSAAARVVAGIYERAQVLTTFPKIGYQYGTDTTREIRVLLYGHYRIAYLVKESGDIDILGIFHGAMDIKRYFP